MDEARGTSTTTIDARKSGGIDDYTSLATATTTTDVTNLASTATVDANPATTTTDDANPATTTTDDVNLATTTTRPDGSDENADARKRPGAKQKSTLMTCERTENPTTVVPTRIAAADVRRTTLAWSLRRRSLGAVIVNSSVTAHAV